MREVTSLKTYVFRALRYLFSMERNRKVWQPQPAAVVADAIGGQRRGLPMGCAIMPGRNGGGGESPTAVSSP